MAKNPSAFLNKANIVGQRLYRLAGWMHENRFWVYPSRVYKSFEQIPSLIYETLLLIEDRAYGLEEHDSQAQRQNKHDLHNSLQPLM